MVRHKMESRVEAIERSLQELQRRADEAAKQRTQDELRHRNSELMWQQVLGKLEELERGTAAGQRRTVPMSEEKKSGGTVRPEDRQEWWCRNLEVPKFSGNDASGWIKSIERYFRLRGIPDEERLETALIALEGRALAWYQWWEWDSYTMTHTWQEFKDALIKRFQPFEVLLGLKQEGSVMEYKKRFEIYSGSLGISDPSYLKGIFLTGLKEEIRDELRLHQLKSLAELMDMALLIDQRNVVVKKEGSIRSNNWRQMSNAEYQEKWRKGLCFRCDEKFGPDHICKNKNLRVILLEDEATEPGNA